jgi:hypothetical protein
MIGQYLGVEDGNMYKKQEDLVVRIFMYQMKRLLKFVTVVLAIVINILLLNFISCLLLFLI